MAPSARLQDWTAEDDREELYRAGYEYAGRRLGAGLDPEAVRAEFAAVAGGLARPFSAETRRGIDDALAGPRRIPGPTSLLPLEEARAAPTRRGGARREEEP